MKTILRTSEFKRDVKRMQRRSKNFDSFKQIVRMLAADEALPLRYRDHALVGQYRGTRECHIQPDWLLIYESNAQELILIRTGTHGDLFG